MSPEEHFRDGLNALQSGSAQQAVRHFEAAISAEKHQGAVRPQMRYVSYYGLSLALADRPTHAAVAFCETAAERDSFDPVLQLNLGRVYVMSGRITKAIQVFRRGLEMEPTNIRLQQELKRIERRSPPVIGALHRDHPVNRSLGRLRASWFSRR